MSRRLSALVILGAALLAGGPLERDARAEEPRLEEPATIAVLCAAGDRFSLRVLAELEALGFHGVLLEPTAEAASRSSLEVSARKAGAIAAIRAVPSERGVEVWIADRVTGKTVLRELASEGGAPDRDDALALRAVELLRASLLLACINTSRLSFSLPPELQHSRTIELTDARLEATYDVGTQDAAMNCGEKIGPLQHGTIDVVSIDGQGLTFKVFGSYDAAYDGTLFAVDGLYTASICP